MRRYLVFAALILLSGTCAVALDGLAPFGRLALSFGLPRLAEPLLEDPHWKGVALFRQGRYQEAVAALRAAGPEGYYVRGNALAWAGRFNEAIEVYDAQIFRAPRDQDSHFNRKLVLDFVAVVGEGRLSDDGMTKGVVSGAEADEAEKVDAMTEAWNRWRESGRRTFADQAVVASRQWLTTLPDEPGRYLKLRLAAEHKRRFEARIGMAPGPDPW